MNIHRRVRGSMINRSQNRPRESVTPLLRKFNKLTYLVELTCKRETHLSSRDRRIQQTFIYTLKKIWSTLSRCHHYTYELA